MHVGSHFEKKTSPNISPIRLSINRSLSDSVTVTEHMNTYQTPGQCWFIVEPESTRLKTTLIERLLSWQNLATCPLGTSSDLISLPSWLGFVRYAQDI